MGKIPQKFNYQLGLATLEIMIAMALIVIAISTVILLVFGSQSFNVGSQTNQEALYLAQQQIESARASLVADFNSNPSASTAPTGYTNNFTITQIDSFTKQITSKYTWTATGTEAQITTRVSDFFSAAGICNPNLSGDWKNPQLLGTVDVGQNNGGTDVYTIANKAYVTTDPSANGKPDFYVIDISDPNLSNLPILGSTDTNPTSTAGLSSVTVSGNYAYVANQSTLAQLQVIDISNPASPLLVGSLRVTPGGDTAVGESIFYSKQRIYLGLDRPSTGPEFFVIDVSNPLNITAASIKATVEMNTEVSNIIVKNGIAYLAVPDNPLTAGVSEQLRVFDVSNADAGLISEDNSFHPNPSTMSGQGLYISADAKTLYFGEGGANSGHKAQFFSLNVANPNSISQINSKYINTANDVTVNAIAVRSNLAFMVTSDPNLGFQIWDLNNLSSIYSSKNIQQGIKGGLSCSGNLIFVAQRSNKALQIIGPGILLKDPSVASTIYDNSTNLPVSSVASGATVYDKAVLSGSAGTPTGTVDFNLYTNKDNCSGTKTTETKTLVSGTVSSSTYTTNNKSISYQVHYNGDANYNPADGPCEPLIVN
jgi:Tfp pilus assembly protein PilV